uniref:Uncharacterized protein n=1 Tax=Lepeophtheirus salmonis TaxID=72036 RepID=A0A0K2USP2_LEPSM
MDLFLIVVGTHLGWIVEKDFHSYQKLVFLLG